MNHRSNKSRMHFDFRTLNIARVISLVSHERFGDNETNERPAQKRDGFLPSKNGERICNRRFY